MTPARAGRADTPAKRLLRQALMVAIALGAVAFAVEGGEFGTSDVVLQKGRRQRLQAEVEGLRVEVESLKAEVKSMNTDDARLERIAREQFGMVKGDKEVLYWTARGNAAAGTASSTAAGVGAAADDARDTSESQPRG
jgi:cell division protein FtsB